MAADIPRERIRNFCIVAHIDHGKSTLADRLLETTGSLTDREKRDQFLDNMDLERERGITIKAQTARMRYRARDGHDYLLNLIDTPGHVDFSYEVSRALQACEGAVLVVDAAQGIEAQTLANAYLAIDGGLEILPVVNKIDLPSADPIAAAQEVEDVVGLDAADVLPISAKTGQGIEDLLEAIVEKVPPPGGDPDAAPRALVFDSWFDTYVGAVMLVRVIDGELRKRQRIQLMAQKTEHEITQLSVIEARPRPVDRIRAGEVGVVIGSIKTLAEVKIGDTVTDAVHPASEALPGFEEVKPMVFAGLYPVDAEDYEDMKVALEKLKLNDSSFVLRAGDERGARLRVPVWLPGLSPCRDRSGAARARVQPRSHHDRADRALPRRPQGGRALRDREPGCAAGRTRRDPGADRARHDSRSVGVSRRRALAVPGSTRPTARHGRAREPRAGSLCAPRLARS